MKGLFLIILFCSLAVVTSCGGSAFNEGENFGNLLDTTGGLTLSQSEHEIGWGQADCLPCHNLENIHLVNRTGTAIDIVAIHNQALSGGIASCASCHGNNGAP